MTQQWFKQSRSERDFIFMRKLFSLSLLLIGTSAFAQNSLTFQELLNIYLAKSKSNAIQAVESKGYTQAIVDQSTIDLVPILYSRSQDSSMIGLVFRNKKVSEVVLKDSVTRLERMLSELHKMNFELVDQRESLSRVYVKKGVKYFVRYSIPSESSKEALISISRKTKHTRSIYNPKW